MSFIYKMIRRFSRDEQGNLVVEAVMVLPVMFWAMAALFSYWDAYRSINTVQKAAYTISDLISRSQGKVNDAYIAGLRGTMNYMLDADQATTLRITSFRWSQLNNRYEVIWSRSPGTSLATLNNASLALLSARLPVMSDGDSAVLVEATVPYTPAMRFGVEPQDINQFVVTRPRFLPRICHVSLPCPAV